MTKSVLLSIDGSMATITFNRPDAMNAFNRELAQDLVAITAEVRNNESIRAVILNGSGNMFMAGGDIRMFFQMLDTMPEGVPEMIDMLHAAVSNLMLMPKPVLASVHGSVAGAGISLMMAADLIIAADDTKMTLAYSSLGISTDGGATYNLPRQVGNKKAMELLLLSDVFDAKEALEYGLINWAVPLADLQKTTLKIATKLSKGPTKSYAHIKRLMGETWRNTLDEQLAAEAQAFIDCTTTKDFHKGVTSFVKKERPEFEGS